MYWLEPKLNLINWWGFETLTIWSVRSDTQQFSSRRYSPFQHKQINIGVYIKTTYLLNSINKRNEKETVFVDKVRSPGGRRSIHSVCHSQLLALHTIFMQTDCFKEILPICIYRSVLMQTIVLDTLTYRAIHDLRTINI